MAKKKAKKKSTHRRRSRVSGIGDTLMPILGGAAGMLAGKLLSGALSGKVNNKILNAGKVGLALFIPKFIPGALGSAVAIGVGASGVTGLASDLGVISGFYDLPTVNGVGAMRRISGASKQALNGSAKQVLSGVVDADVRKASRANYNPATNTTQLAIVSGCSELDGAGYGD